MPLLWLEDVLPLYAWLLPLVDGLLYVGVVPDVFLSDAFVLPALDDTDEPLVAAARLFIDALDDDLLTEDEREVPVTLFLLTLLLVPRPLRAVVLLVKTLLSLCVSCLGPYQRSLKPLPPMCPWL